MSAGAHLAVFGAGVASFLSPCVLPLVPAYVGVVAGEGERAASGAAVRAAALFVAGFGAVFVALGAIAGGLGEALSAHTDGLARVGGVLVAGFGIVLLASRRGRVAGERRLFSSRRPRLLATVERAGPVARPIVTGVAFGAAWTPCVGPLLGASLVVAARDDAWHGATLLAAYSLGVGVPFLAAALALAAWPVHVARLRRVGRWIEPTAGALLVVLGVALAAGWYTQLVSPLIPS